MSYEEACPKCGYIFELNTTPDKVAMDKDYVYYHGCDDCKKAMIKIIGKEEFDKKLIWEKQDE